MDKIAALSKLRSIISRKSHKDMSDYLQGFKGTDLGDEMEQEGKDLKVMSPEEEAADNLVEPHKVKKKKKGDTI